MRSLLFDMGYLPIKTYSIPLIGVGNLAIGGTGKSVDRLSTLQRSLFVGNFDEDMEDPPKGAFGEMRMRLLKYWVTNPFTLQAS